MSLKSLITKNVVSETLSKIVSFLSSASLNLSSDQIKNLVESKIDENILFEENNDIGYCVSRLLDSCSYNKIVSVEALAEKYTSLREEDDLVTETIDMMAEGIAKQISSILYELREIIPQETKALVCEINQQIPSIESLQEKETALRIFNWGKLQNQNCLSATMLVAKDKANCFKDGVPRQHDSSNVLRRVPYGTMEKFKTDETFTSAMMQILTEEIDQSIGDTAIKTKMKTYLGSAIGLISNEKIYNQTIYSLKEALNGTDLSSNIVDVVEKIDAFEDILKLITTQALNKDENTAVFSARIFSNIENVLTNISLIRASLIFHKIHTLQNKLILSKNTVQESTLTVFREAGGTDQMITDHLTYMELNEIAKIPTNGLSLDVVLNSSAKARAVVQKNADLLTSRASARKVKALQDAVSYSLAVHYQKALESGVYKPTLENIHERQVSDSISALLKKSVGDIALEYLVTLRNNTTMKSFYKAINAELHSLMKNHTDVTQPMIDEAVCSGVVSVIYNSLVKDFAKEKIAA